MSNTFRISIFCLVLSIGCSKYSKKSTEENWTYTTDTISIAYGDNLINNMYTDLTYHREGKTEYVATLEGQSNSLTIYNLSSNDVISNVHLPVEGPDGLGSNISKFTFLSDDSLLFITAKEILISNTNGDVLDRLPQGNWGEKLGSADYANSKFMSQLSSRQIISESQIAVLTFQDMAMSTPEFMLKPYLAGGINLYDHSIELFPISIPESYYQEGHFYDVNAYPGICVNDDDIIFNFPQFPEIFVFNKTSGKKKIIRYSQRDWLKQSPTPNTYFRDYLRRFEVFDNVPVIYFSLLYDANRNLYYRVHFEREESSDYGFRIFVTLFDESLRYMALFDLGNGNIRNQFVGLNGLGFGFIFPDYEDEIRFVFYEFFKKS